MVVKKSKSRKSGKNKITIMVKISEGKDKRKMEKTIQQSILKVRRMLDGELEFEYVIALDEQCTQKAK